MEPSSPRHGGSAHSDHHRHHDDQRASKRPRYSVSPSRSLDQGEMKATSSHSRDEQAVNSKDPNATQHGEQADIDDSDDDVEQDELHDQTIGGHTTLGLGDDDITTVTEAAHDDHIPPSTDQTPAPPDLIKSEVKDQGLPDAQERPQIEKDKLNPGCGQIYSNAPDDRIARNTPVKRNDGDALIRADLQHAVLMEIFGDTTRCFHNPRPAPATLWTSAPKPGESAPTGVHEYTPVYPYGQAKGTSRKSNETPEEFQAWQQKCKEYHDNPYPTKEEDPQGKIPRPGSKLLTFKELYIEALLNSPRCTKAVRDKVWQDEDFAENFACVNLLINIGRMNTTLAFYAQMQTVLRSYHPLPSLQGNDNSRRHMQDAPRMKSLLKSVSLPFEKSSSGTSSAPVSKTAAAAASDHVVPESQHIEQAATLEEVVKRWSEGYLAPTSIVNFLFILSGQSQELTAMHFAQPHDIHSIFFPHKDYPIPAKYRAKVFLWLCWHYLEGGAVLPPGNDKAINNPFADEQSRKACDRARAKWDQLDDKGRRKATIGGRGTLWLGARRSKDKDKDKAAKKEGDSAQSEDPSSAPPATADGDAGESSRQATDGVAAKEATPPAPSAGTSSNPADTPWSLEENDKYTHRVLCPAMEVITVEEIKKENVDAEDEVEWGTRQANDRKDFMARMAEEERQKLLDGTSEVPSSGKGKGKGKGKGTATKGKGKKGRGVAGTELDGRKNKKGKGKASASASAAPDEAMDEDGEVDELQDDDEEEEEDEDVEMDEDGAGTRETPLQGDEGAENAEDGSVLKAAEGGGDGEESMMSVSGPSKGKSAGQGVGKGKGKGVGKGKGKSSAATSQALSSQLKASVDLGKGKGKGWKSGANEIATNGSVSGAADSLDESGVDVKDFDDSEVDSDAWKSRITAEQDDAILSSLSDSDWSTTDLRTLASKIQSARQELGHAGIPSARLQPSSSRPLRITDLDLGSGLTSYPKSLSLYAWNRILQRAIMDKGNAAYDSDDEEVCLNEVDSVGDIFKEEISRIVASLWATSREVEKEGKNVEYPWKTLRVTPE
ncbi:unnamed protein product [Sympodiomycopsis kandeliae]